MKSRKKSNRLRNSLLIAVLIGTSLFPITARSSDPLQDCIDKGQRAIADQDRVINLKGRAIEAQDQIIKAQDVRITELEKKQNSIFSNPMFYVVIGVVAGGLLVGRTK
jgi:hypothetical protein